MHCHFLLQGIFPTQGSKPGLPHCRQMFYRLSHQGNNKKNIQKSESEVTQLCLSLCDPMDCHLPGSSVYGIFQARILEWVAIPFSRASSRPRGRTLVFRIVRRILYHRGSPWLGVGSDKVGSQGTHFQGCYGGPLK